MTRSVTNSEIRSILTDFQDTHISDGCRPFFSIEPCHDALGSCAYEHTYRDGKTYRTGIIHLHSEIRRHPILIKGVLWHEFCHHMTWQLTGKTGHAEVFRRCYEKEPWLCLLNTMALLFVKID